jgi:hypothetical protein
VSFFHVERVRCEDTVRISHPPCLTQPLILGPVFVIVAPTRIQVEAAVRTPQHTAVLLAEFAIGTNPFVVIDLLPIFDSVFSVRLVEAVEYAHEGRVPPAVRGAVVANLECLPPKHCGWADGQQFGLGLDDGVDAFGDLAGPAVLAERGRLDQVAALDVRVVELAHVPEDPVTRQLRHGLLLHSLVVVEIFPEPIELGHIADVILVEWNLLCIHDDCPGPERYSVFSVNFRVFLIAMDLDREIRQHTEVSRTASKNGVEQLGVSGLGNFWSTIPSERTWSQNRPKLRPNWPYPPVWTWPPR